MSRFIAEAAFDVISVRMPPVLIHPIAADDVASELANIEVGLPVAAQEPNVVSLMSKDLTANPEKEVSMIHVEYPPGGSDPVHRHNAQALSTCWKAPL